MPHLSKPFRSKRVCVIISLHSQHLILYSIWLREKNILRWLNLPPFTSQFFIWYLIQPKAGTSSQWEPQVVWFYKNWAPTLSTLPMLRLLLSKAQERKEFWKPSKPCHVGIHWIALAEYSQESTHLPGFQSFFRIFASFCNDQSSHQQHKG